MRATLSLDLDDAWTYLRAAGRPDWQTAASVVPLVCERLLELTGALGQRLSLFVVGRDLETPAKARAVAGVAAAGHEIACHSYDHRPDFAVLTPDELRSEIVDAAEAIERLIGKRPVGFRAPGYARHPQQTPVLAEAGFAYDGSSLPTFLGPLCRAYYFFKSGMSKAERKRRAAMYGGLRDAFASNRARPAAMHPGLLQVPVTTVPMLRTPFHMSYLIWLAKRSRRLAMAYLRTALRLCRIWRVEPSFLLHSLDFVGGGEADELAFFPAMQVPWRDKRALLIEAIGRLQSGFRLLPMDAYCAEVQGRGATPSRPATGGAGA